MTPQHADVIAVGTGRPVPAYKPEPEPGPMNNHPGPDFPGAGASGVGPMDTSPDTDAISILQRVRDGLAALPAISTEGNEAA